MELPLLQEVVLPLRGEGWDNRAGEGDRDLGEREREREREEEKHIHGV